MFQNVELILGPLKTLPRLAKLTIQVKGKEDEYLIVQALPGLQVLNNQSARELIQTNP